MSEDQKNLGAPSSDETSALFVSARKKQLAQQEEERKRKEEEDKRLDEVRKFEEEVRIRKQQAEEEASRIEQEKGQARQAQEQSGKASKILDKMPLGKTAAAHKSEKSSKPGAAPASKLNPKLLAIIGGVVVIAVVLILVLSGGKSDKPSDLFSMNLKSFLELSAADQTAFLMSCEKFLDEKEYKRVDDKGTTEEDDKARLDGLVKSIKSMAISIEDADIGQAFLEASGLPMVITSWAYEMDGTETIKLLRENVQYKEWTEKELTGLNLIDFMKLPGDECVSALLAAQDWFITNGITPDQQSDDIFGAMIGIQGSVGYVANQGGANATKAMSFLAGFGYLSGYDPAQVEGLTQYPYGVFVSAPTLDDPLDAECVITGLGYKVFYPGSTFTIAELERTSVRIYPTTNLESASISFGFSEKTVPDNVEDFQDYLSQEALAWIQVYFGDTEGFIDGAVNFTNDPDLPMELIYTAYYFDVDSNRFDVYVRVAITNEKPYTMVVVAHPNHMEKYLAIANKIRSAIEKM